VSGFSTTRSRFPARSDHLGPALLLSHGDHLLRRAREEHLLDALDAAARRAGLIPGRRCQFRLHPARMGREQEIRLPSSTASEWSE